jgi:sugar O-acyltransferase (sialic acid O-acetyltransferase NeuD family)
MRSVPFIIYGGGGHGRVILDAARLAGLSPDCFIDDNPGCMELDGIPVISSGSPWWCGVSQFDFVVAIGKNETRARVYETLLTRGGRPTTIVHPSAIISSRSKIGSGSVAMPGIVVNAGAQIGINTILNTSCSIDHDCCIGDHVHICPGARLAGGIRVGSLSMVGTGACIIPGIQIGSQALVGAGSVVVRDLPDGSKALGNPARIRSL